MAKRKKATTKSGTPSQKSGTPSQPISQATTKRDNNQDSTQDEGREHQEDSQNSQDSTQILSKNLTDNPDQAMGDVPATDAPTESAGDLPSRAKDLSKRVSNRLMKEKRWFGQIEFERDEMMRDASVKKQFPDKDARRLFVYGELDRLYPPKEDSVLSDKDIQDRTVSAEQSSVQKGTVSGRDDGQIQGLSKIPDAWPEMPANASLSAEVGWVQANRLRCVDEQPGHATVVDLEQAMSPAPSWSALGWLETSIRSYAKFVDVAAKATASGDDEGAAMRRERMALDEVRELLDEMTEAEGKASEA